MTRQPSVDIGVCMSEKVLEHKKRDGRTRLHKGRFGAVREVERRYCFWRMTTIPPSVKKGSRLWIASGGVWRGYFVLDSVLLKERLASSLFQGGELRFKSESWQTDERGQRSPFRGFTYETPARFPE